MSNIQNDITDKPILIYCVGLPASGKSTWAEQNKDKFNAVIHSSDAIRKECFGDVNEQSQNEAVFQILHKRVKDDLKSGKNVIYDSTGTRRKARMHLLRELKNIDCKKICVFMATPYEYVLVQNSKRDRRVPVAVINKMYTHFQIPCQNEGWDDIQIIYYEADQFYLNWVPWYNRYRPYGNWLDFYHQYADYDQENSHHTLSLGDHCKQAFEYTRQNFPDDAEVQYAAIYHDCGKPKCKTFINAKTNTIDNEAHYYGHEYVSCYDSLFYHKGDVVNALNVALLIEMHMKPYTSWKQSDKARERDKEFLGEELYNKVLRLNEADRASR